MHAWLFALLVLTMQVSAPLHTPQLLQVYREPLRSGSEAAYSQIEEDTARKAAALGCPHPYLGAETLTGSKEAWWFNGYQSEAEQRQVADDYAKNAPLLTALQQNSQRKASLTLKPIEVLARYRKDLSAGQPWILGQGRFLIVTVTRNGHLPAGTVFETPDGTRFSVTSAQNLEQATALKAQAGPQTQVLAVRPSWSFPASEWITMDSAFWRPAQP